MQLPCCFCLTFHYSTGHLLWHQQSSPLLHTPCLINFIWYIVLHYFALAYSSEWSWNSFLVDSLMLDHSFSSPLCAGVLAGVFKAHIVTVVHIIYFTAVLCFSFLLSKAPSESFSRIQLCFPRVPECFYSYTLHHMSWAIWYTLYTNPLNWSILESKKKKMVYLLTSGKSIVLSKPVLQTNKEALTTESLSVCSESVSRLLFKAWIFRDLFNMYVTYMHTTSEGF